MECKHELEAEQHQETHGAREDEHDRRHQILSLNEQITRDARFAEKLKRAKLLARFKRLDAVARAKRKGLGSHQQESAMLVARRVTSVSNTRVRCQDARQILSGIHKIAVVDLKEELAAEATAELAELKDEEHERVAEAMEALAAEVASEREARQLAFDATQTEDEVTRAFQAASANESMQSLAFINTEVLNQKMAAEQDAAVAVAREEEAEALVEGKLRAESECAAVKIECRAEVRAAAELEIETETMEENVARLGQLIALSDLQLELTAEYEEAAADDAIIAADNRMEAEVEAEQEEALAVEILEQTMARAPEELCRNWLGHRSTRGSQSVSPPTWPPLPPNSSHK